MKNIKTVKKKKNRIKNIQTNRKRRTIKKIKKRNQKILKKEMTNIYNKHFGGKKKCQ